MAQSPVINALIEKRSEIGGIVADLEDRISHALSDLAHIDAALRMFDPNIRLKNITIRRPLAKRNDGFANGEVSRRIREALRNTPELVRADAIVRQMMADKGLDPGDKSKRQPLLRSSLWALHRLHARGDVQKVGHGLGAKWALPPE
jgi:hypothetical protein